MRSQRRFLLLVPATAAMFFVLAGCTSTVSPPPEPQNPVTVFVVTSGLHTGLFVPEDDGSWTEWGYGDWDWYARNRNAWYRVFDTVLWPTQGALGRRSWRAMPGFPAQALQVPRERLSELKRRLAAAYSEKIDSELHNPRYGMSFVHHDSGFWFLHNCHDQMVEWLRALDCPVSSAPIRLGLRLDGN